MSEPDPRERPVATLVELRTHERDRSQPMLAEAEAGLREAEQELEALHGASVELEQELTRAASVAAGEMTAAQARASETYRQGLKIDLDVARAKEQAQRAAVTQRRQMLERIRAALTKAEAELRAAQRQLDRLQSERRRSDEYREELEAEDLDAARRHGNG
jgi:flagellar biosynthesis chaperone FliJ